eukprot:scaffold257_cov76-Isochrysis_galbana.AAC.1
MARGSARRLARHGTRRAQTSAARQPPGPKTNGGTAGPGHLRLIVRSLPLHSSAPPLAFACAGTPSSQSPMPQPTATTRTRPHLAPEIVPRAPRWPGGSSPSSTQSPGSPPRSATRSVPGSRGRQAAERPGSPPMSRPSSRGC